MSGFFDRMAERGAGVEPSLRLRPPQRFEAAPPELDAVSELPTPAPVPAVVELPRAAEAESRAVVPAAPANVPPRVVAQRDPVPPEPAAPERVEREVAVAPPAPEPVVPAPDERSAEPPAAAPAEPPTPAPAEPPDPIPVADEAPRAPPSSPSSRPAPESPPRRLAAPPPEVDVVTLLREHVVPVLVARGYVRRGERPVIRERPAAAVATPSPGTISVTPDAVTRDVDEAEPQVNLSIGRIVVTRAPAAPPSAAPPRRETVDHEAYLARREARR